MATFDLRSTFTSIVGVFAIAAVAGPSAAFAAGNLSAAAEQAAQELVATIGEIQALHGGNSPELIEPLTALITLHEEYGEYELALALIEHTSQVIEVNYGLHTVDEALLMRRAVRIYRALGNAEAAWDEEQEMLRLIRRRRHQADARIVPLLQEVAAHRRAVLARYRAGEFPPEIILGCYYSELVYEANGIARRTGCRSGDRETVIRVLRRDAESFEAEAAAVAGRIERWIELPCAKPQAAATVAKRRSTQPSKDELQAYFLAVSDYAGCTQAKYEHVARTIGSGEELLQLAADKQAAAAELAMQATLYNQRFGRR